MPELLIENLDAGYGAVSVLHGLNLRVDSGETVMLLGTNGNGKSTLMKCLAGLVRPTSGRIIYRDGGVQHDLLGLMPHDLVELGISLVPEGRRLFPLLSVRENLELGAYRRGARAAMATSLDFAMATFPALAAKRDQPAGSLSGGQQQMVAIARALMSQPRLLLIDEPSVGLSPLLVGQVMDTIASLKQTLGLTVLMAEQNIQQAARIADRGYVLVHGEVVLQASTVDLMANAEIKRIYLGI